MTDRTNIIERILNLRELAEHGASEAEAMNAMNIAAKLMHSYRVEEAELALAEGLGEVKVDIVSETKSPGIRVGRNRHKVQSSLWAIERYCEVEVVLKGGGERVHAIGDKPDVELFWYLLDLVRNAMDSEYNRWKRGQQGIGRGAKASFQLAMSSRINARLGDMVAERRKQRSDAEQEAAKLLNRPAEDIRMAVNNGDIQQLSSSMALVVASAAEQKRKAVSEAYKTAYRGVRLGRASGFSYRGGNSAAAAGRAAGNNVSFSRPVGGSSNKLLR